MNKYNIPFYLDVRELSIENLYHNNKFEQACTYPQQSYRVDPSYFEPAPLEYFHIRPLSFSSIVEPENDIKFKIQI